MTVLENPPTIHIALPAWSRPNNSRPKLTEGKRRNRAKNPANHLPRPPDAGVVGILGDGLLSTWSWFTSSDALSRNVGSLLVAAAATVPVPVENADEAEFGLPLAPPPMGLIPPPELGVAALRAGVTAAALPAPKLLMLVAALRVLPAFTPGIAGGAGPLGMPISASAAASILACDQPAWAADISGVISDLSFGVCWRAGERGAVERFGLLLASLFRSIKPWRLFELRGSNVLSFAKNVEVVAVAGRDVRDPFRANCREMGHTQTARAQTSTYFPLALLNWRNRPQQDTHTVHKHRERDR